MGTEDFKTRCNAVKLSSIEEFEHVKGRMNHGCKDVYFFRVIGVNQKVLREIKHMDQALTEKKQQDGSFYYRFQGLPRLSRIQDADYYGACYEEWSRCKKQQAFPRSAGQNQELSAVLARGCQEVLGLLARERPGMNGSIEKNFIVKLFYWLDQTVAEPLERWEPEGSNKVVFTEVCKQQEYLFCYLLTLLGFDVLLLQEKDDIDPKAEKLGLSEKCVTKDTESLSVPKYDPNNCGNRDADAGKRERNSVKTSLQREPVLTEMQQKSQSGAVHTVVNVRVPERDRRTQNMLNARNSGSRREQSAQTGGGRKAQPPQTVRTGEGIPKRELTYEELALFSSSVVQIMIHDDRGNIIGGGSGIMIGRDGYILTNNHVACRGRYYSVRIEEEEQIYHTNEMIKYNSVLDLAVIRIDRRLEPIPIYQGERKLVRGQKVVAIGSPLGLFNSVSDGIIAGFRVIENVDMIQFTAPISSGSSGGAVLNMYGEVIGISTAGFDDGQNINLAVGYEYIQTFVQGFL
ncbi:MAG: trypsin-like serine protease [Lachnospiraceae bacterium]|nr:trypsin-like serine protease [Lachnospiraceae bacterium]